MSGYTNPLRNIQCMNASYDVKYIHRFCDAVRIHNYIYDVTRWTVCVCVLHRPIYNIERIVQFDNMEIGYNVEVCAWGPAPTTREAKQAGFETG